MKEKLTYNQDDLAILIKNRDQKAFGYLYDNYSKAIFGVIHTIVKDIEESEDILQKTFLKIWNSIDSYDTSKGRLYTWMLNISRNLAIDFKRSKSSKNKNQNIDEKVWNDIITEVDGNGDGEISFVEFKTMMQKILG